MRIQLAQRFRTKPSANFKLKHAGSYFLSPKQTVLPTLRVLADYFAGSFKASPFPLKHGPHQGRVETYLSQTRAVVIFETTESLIRKPYLERPGIAEVQTHDIFFAIVDQLTNNPTQEVKEKLLAVRGEGYFDWSTKRVLVFRTIAGRHRMFSVIGIFLGKRSHDHIFDFEKQLARFVGTEKK